MSESVNTLASIIKGRCPKCRQKNIYLQENVFPLNGALKTFDYCACGQKIRIEGHENASGINYAASVIVYVLATILYACVWEITYKNDSFIYAFIFSTLIVVLLQPWLMRLSKTIYIYAISKYK